MSVAASPVTFESLVARLESLEVAHAAVKAERDEYKQLYVALTEAYRKLEAGLTRHHRERFASGEQTTLALMGLMLGAGPDAAASPPAPPTVVEKHERAKPTGRKPLPEKLPRLSFEVLPLEVQRAGLDAFERIGEDVTETVEHRASSLVVVRVVRGKYIAKAAAAAAAAATAATTTADSSVDVDATDATLKVLQGEVPELPIPRALAGPGLLADTIVKRWEDHSPLHRMERIYGRDGLPLARSTLCGWHQEVARLALRLVKAMWADALATAPYLCMDATGVLVQHPEKCRTGHFFVVVAPGRHVLYGYTPTHDGDAVDALVGGYRGVLLADAHSVYEHLYEDGTILKAGCWCHARRYYCKALDSDGGRARHALALIQKLFKLERDWKSVSPEERLRLRQAQSAPIIESYFAWCDDEALKVLDATPISRAIGYSRNQREALSLFLTDGRIPIHNNFSENALRREALGRKNWMFLGNDDGGDVNATLVTLLASCRMHSLEPRAYLRDLLCLLPRWSIHRLLELAPLNWAATLERHDVQQHLADNIFRQASLGTRDPDVKP